MRLWRDEDGAALVEYALVLPALLAVMVGLVQLGGMAYTQTTLNYAVQEAARCAVVRPDLCGSPSQIQQFAASQAVGLNLAANAFTVATTACGVDIRANVPYNFVVSPFNQISVPLAAEVCRE
jgi:Flp pilus assembly protein TadG